jgi:hypothetical protein
VSASESIATLLPELPDLLARRPVRSELTYQLVALERAYSAIDPPPAEPWEQFYAERLIQVFFVTSAEESAWENSVDQQ